MSNILKPTLFGDPVLREAARRLKAEEIRSAEIQQLVADMKFTLEKKKYGVGLAAPQVGQGIALSVIGIKATPTRPKLEPVELVIFNPEIVKTYGSRSQMWEGCISLGGSRDFPYAKCLRWRKIRLRYLDEHGERQEVDFDGFLAHVLQHETDHLNGILFVDRVKNTKTFMMASEYKKHELTKKKLKTNNQK